MPRNILYGCALAAGTILLGWAVLDAVLSLLATATALATV